MISHRLTFTFQLLVTLACAAFLMVPAGASLVAGVTANYFQGPGAGLTLRWIAEVLRLYSSTIGLSLAIALGTLAVTLVLGVPAAWALARKPGRRARLVEELVTLPVAIPGLALALGLLLAYGGIRPFRMSPLFILTGHVLYTLPFMLRSVMAVMAAMDVKALEEGAASLGASPLQRFLQVVVPNAKGGILAGALMVVTLSIGEFNLTWMLHTPMMKTLPVGLADSYASMRLEIASAYTLIFFVLIVPLLVALQVIARAFAPDAGPARRP